MAYINKILTVLSVIGLIATGVEKNNFSKVKHTTMKLNAGIITEKLKETRAFYLRVLNFSVKFENEWFVLLETPGGTDQLSFLQAGHPSQQPVYQAAFAGKGVYLTIEVNDVDGEYKRIRSLDIPIEIAIRDEDWGDRHFSILDPNGVGIDIVRYTAPEE